MSRTLIAGCGDVGLRVAVRLAGRGSAVTGLRRSPGELPHGIDTLAADVREPRTLIDLPADVTRVVYLPTPDVRTPQAYQAVFVDGLRNLLAALDTAVLERVVLITSSAVYGDHDGAWVDEHAPVDPPGFNGRILHQAEQWLAVQPVTSSVLRLAGLYGPGRTRLFDRLRSGKVRVRREPPFWSNRIHVDDAAAAILCVLDAPQPQPLYLGVDDTPLPLAELYDYLAVLLGVPAPAAGPAPSGVGSKRLSNARLRAAGFEPRWPDAREGYASLIGVA